MSPHHSPAAIVRCESLRPPRQRNLIEAGFRHRQHYALLHRLERELDERHRLRGIVVICINRVRMPAEREQPLRLHLFDDEVDRLPAYTSCAFPTAASTVVGVMTPCTVAPGAKPPSKRTPNQLPNSPESASARQTRFSDAYNRTFFRCDLYPCIYYATKWLLIAACG